MGVPGSWKSTGIIRALASPSGVMAQPRRRTVVMASAPSTLRRLTIEESHRLGLQWVRAALRRIVSLPMTRPGVSSSTVRTARSVEDRPLRSSGVTSVTVRGSVFAPVRGV